MIYPTDVVHPSPAPHFKPFQVFLICCPKRPMFSTTQSQAPNVTFYKFLSQIQVEFAGKKNLLLVGWTERYVNSEINWIHSVVSN
jgi:hypothetical protein